MWKKEGEQKGSARGSVHWRSLLNLKSRMASPMASAAFAVPLPVLVVNDRDGVKHRGTLQLPRRAPAAAPGRPSSADLARLRPLMRALGDALAAQEEGLDPERLSNTYAALMAELQEVAGMGVHAVELTPATLAPVLPEGEEGDEEGEEEDEQGEEGDERRNAQLAELPEELRALAGEVRELAVRSTRLAVVPVWVGELTRLEALEISGVGYDEGNTLLKSLPALQARDVLAIGRALKAWPLPLLHDVEGLLRLSTCWRALGLPGAAADEDWTNATTLDYFRVQQQKVAAFASGMHWRLGAASGVSWLDEQALVMIADEVLGGWGLLKEWRQELVAAKV